MCTHKPISRKWIYRKLEGEKAFMADRLDFNDLTISLASKLDRVERSNVETVPSCNYKASIY